MLTFDLLYQTIGAAYLAVLTYPNLPPDPTLIAQLEQARPAVSGENGYAALFDLPMNAGKDWPKDLPECRRETADCLALAREHLAAWQNTTPETRAAWQQQGDTINRLRQYDSSRPQPGQYGDNWPPFRPLVLENTLHAYRFAAGERDAAQHGACRDAKLGLRFIQSHGLMLQSMVGIALVERNIALLAQMRAELPPETLLPADCNALQPQPAETLALCPLMYGEWLGGSESIHAEDAKIAADPEASDADKSFYFILMRQTEAQWLYKNSRYCLPEILAAVAHDEVRVPAPEQRKKYCSLLNPVCKMEGPDWSNYQARLLNANRYLRAFELLQHPEAPLPPGYSRDSNGLSFSLHPEKADTPAPTITLPLPGSRLNP